MGGIKVYSAGGNFLWARGRAPGFKYFLNFYIRIIPRFCALWTCIENILVHLLPVI
jgi:hypothetical protein